MSMQNIHKSTARILVVVYHVVPLCVAICHTVCIPGLQFVWSQCFACCVKFGSFLYGGAALTCVYTQSIQMVTLPIWFDLGEEHEDGVSMFCGLCSYAQHFVAYVLNDCMTGAFLERL